MNFSSFIDTIHSFYKNYLEKIFARLITIFTPKSIQIKRLKLLEEKAKKIADEKKIPFPFQCEIKYQRGKSFYSVGCSYRKDIKINGKFPIYIYSSYTMLSEIEILLTIFHEYGHFVYDFAQPNAKIQLNRLFIEKKFPILTKGGLVEDFSECFANIIVKNLYLVDKGASNQIENLICNSILNLEKYDNLYQYEIFCSNEKYYRK